MAEGGRSSIVISPVNLRMTANDLFIYLYLLIYLPIYLFSETFCSKVVMVDNKATKVHILDTVSYYIIYDTWVDFTKGLKLSPFIG